LGSALPTRPVPAGAWRVRRGIPSTHHTPSPGSDRPRALALYACLKRHLSRRPGASYLLRRTDPRTRRPTARRLPIHPRHSIVGSVRQVVIPSGAEGRGSAISGRFPAHGGNPISVCVLMAGFHRQDRVPPSGRTISARDSKRLPQLRACLPSRSVSFVTLTQLPSSPLEYVVRGTASRV